MGINDNNKKIFIKCFENIIEIDTNQNPYKYIYICI